MRSPVWTLVEGTCVPSHSSWISLNLKTEIPSSLLPMVNSTSGCHRRCDSKSFKFPGFGSDSGSKTCELGYNQQNWL